VPLSGATALLASSLAPSSMLRPSALTDRGPEVSAATIPSRFEGVDLVIVHENNEGALQRHEHEVVPGVVESLRIITEKASTRIARFAFQYAGSTAQAGDRGAPGRPAPGRHRCGASSRMSRCGR
jgi:isocitrate/isopropylmalate dehydrogenase